MMKSIVPLQLALFLTAALFPAPAHAQFMRLSESEEVELGRQAAVEVERRYPVLRNRSVQNAVNSLGQRLAGYSGRNIPYHFRVLDLPEVNAFALPGGYVYINRGVLELAANNNEVAGVLAHEIAHVAHRHSIEQVRRAQKIGLAGGLLDLFLGGRGTGGQIAVLAGQMVGTGVFMKYSRDAERQADRSAVRIMQRSGMDPIGMLTFLQRMERASGRRTSGWFSSHPSLKERQRNVADLIRTS